jgi:hypothetical protein
MTAFPMNPFGGAASKNTETNETNPQTMILRLSLLLLTAAAITSCRHYPVDSKQGQEHPCYSTWHSLPHNS